VPVVSYPFRPRVQLGRGVRCMATLSRYARQMRQLSRGRGRSAEPPRRPARCRLLSAPGRVAQWESARFTRERSLVRNQPRPSDETPAHFGFSLHGRAIARESGLPELELGCPLVPIRRPSRGKPPTAEPGAGGRHGSRGRQRFLRSCLRSCRPRRDSVEVAPDKPARAGGARPCASGPIAADVILRRDRQGRHPARRGPPLVRGGAGRGGC
jgi:hypothetical protein